MKKRKLYDSLHSANFILYPRIQEMMTNPRDIWKATKAMWEDDYILNKNNNSNNKKISVQV